MLTDDDIVDEPVLDAVDVAFDVTVDEIVLDALELIVELIVLDGVVLTVLEPDLECVLV